VKADNPVEYSCEGKRRYASWQAAIKESKRAARRRGGDEPVLRPYLCNWCRGVHLYSVDSVERGKRLIRFQYHED